MKQYVPRVVDAEIEAALSSAGAVVLRGARAVGKTESARRLAASEIRLDSAEPLAALARQQPGVALQGDAPRLIDEWQLVPAIWNEVRHEVDKRALTGQFILSGSAIPDDDHIRHSGAGRFRRVSMRTMTLAETGHSTAAVSLRALLAGATPETAVSQAEFEDVVRRVVTGGWPGWFGVDESVAAQRAMSYLDDIAEHDFVQVAGDRRDPRRFSAYLRAIAAFSAQPAAYAAVKRRIEHQENRELGNDAVSKLHNLAARMYLVEDQAAWAPKLRSSVPAVQTPKRHLTDPSLAAALLGATTQRLLVEPETLGFLFESQVVHDLRVYAQAVGARGVFHYRDSKGRDEIDAVVEGDDGSWLAFEVKLGAASVDAAADNLLRIKAKMQRAPRACVIVVPSGVAHVRGDGVFVVPLSVLGA